MARPTPNRVFEDYDPPSDLVTEEGYDTLLIYLPGFKKEQLRVQLTTSRMLKISGERPIGDYKYRRFQKEFRVPSNCDTKEITAKFEGGILYIRQPKLITPVAGTAELQDKGKAAAEAPKPQQQVPPQQAQPQQQAPPPPQPQVPQDLPSPHPRPQQEAPPPTQSQPQEQIPEEAPTKSSEEEAKAEKREKEKDAMMAREKNAMAGNDQERKDQCGLQQRPRQVVGSSDLFRELRKPDNLKWLGISVLLVLIIGFYISYMFKSFVGNEQHSLLEYDLEL